MRQPIYENQIPLHFLLSLGFLGSVSTSSDSVRRCSPPPGETRRDCAQSAGVERTEMDFLRRRFTNVVELRSKTFEQHHRQNQFGQGRVVNIFEPPGTATQPPTAGVDNYGVKLTEHAIPKRRPITSSISTPTMGIST